MIFLNFFQLLENEIGANFSLTKKCFHLTNFFIEKQTWKILKNNFQKTIFH